MKMFCFTVDDNIRFLKEITQQGYKSIFEHPYAAMLKRLHEEFDLKVQLNLFYRTDGFTLKEMTAAHYREWEENAGWLKLSFHSDYENVNPYEFSGYDEVYRDCDAVQKEIVRFASPAALAKTTTVHYCLTTPDGLRALKDNGVCGLLGLYGTQASPAVSYSRTSETAARIRSGETVTENGITFAPIDIVLNLYAKEENLRRLDALMHRDKIWIMIHEQYFYADYPAYQPDFEEKLCAVFSSLFAQGYKSAFFEELI